MDYAPFYPRFPHIGANETRVLTVLEGSSVDLPPGEYGLLDFYCTTVNCDCRRTFLNVVTKKTNKVQAVIAFGWESRDFYIRWFGSDDAEVIDDLKGPALAAGHPQSRMANQLLKVVTELVLSDQAYVERLKRHYQMFKASLPVTTPRAQPPLQKRSKVKPRK